MFPVNPMYDPVKDASWTFARELTWTLDISPPKIVLPEFFRLNVVPV
ncbi:MAG: hypothetical protein P1S60_16990 [Anaerolineae bacterium]|nr:hypothetical protein [Anaerolineae bacterium]